MVDPSGLSRPSRWVSAQGGPPYAVHSLLYNLQVQVVRLPSSSVSRRPVHHAIVELLHVGLWQKMGSQTSKTRTMLVII